MRLIDADALKARIMVDAPDFLDGGSSITKAFIMAMLETRNVTPTIDAVQIVRCKDCKHRFNGCCYNKESDRVNFGIYVGDDWFCADGERR